MAESKKVHVDREHKETPDELLSKETEKDREAVLGDRDPSREVSRVTAESSNLEFQAADHFVNSEKTIPAERPRRVLVTNHTPAGLPSDVHQALVASSQLRRNEAMAYRDIQALIAKYDAVADRDYGWQAIPDDVRKHLEEELAELKSAADFDENARVLLEKYV